MSTKILTNSDYRFQQWFLKQAITKRQSLTRSRDKCFFFFNFSVAAECTTDRENESRRVFKFDCGTASVSVFVSILKNNNKYGHDARKRKRSQRVLRAFTNYLNTISRGTKESAKDFSFSSVRIRSNRNGEWRAVFFLFFFFSLFPLRRNILRNPVAAVYAYL